VFKGVVGVREFCCKDILISFAEWSSHLLLLRTFVSFEFSKTLFSNGSKRETNLRIEELEVECEDESDEEDDLEDHIEEG
jgi:hypothetical protein